MDVGIVGCGNVGTTSAFALLYSPPVNTINIYDINTNLLEGICKDLEDAGYAQDKNVKKISINELKNNDIVIITAGKKQKKNQKRKNLFKTNALIVDNILSQLKGYKKPIILVTNPVDLLAEYFQEKYKDLDIRSTGTRLDMQRLHIITNGKGKIKGTHDDNQIVIIDNKVDKELTKKVQKKAYDIIKSCGSTKYGIANIIKIMVEDIEKEKK